MQNHKVVFSSGVAHQLLGYSKEEYFEFSQDFYKTLVHPDDCATVRQTIQKVIESKKAEVFEMTVRFRKSDGSYLWAHSRQMVFLRGKANKNLTIIREVEDVSQLVQLEQALQDKVEQLKTVSYKNAHLLRSPVASIIGLVGLIEEQAVTREHNRQVLHFLKEAIMKLDNVVHEINDAARH